MKKKIIQLLTCVLVCISLSSCATVNRWFDSTQKNKRMYTVKITSKTPGLMVFTTEKGVERYVGTTPCYIYSDRAKIKYVTVKRGDIYQTVPLKTRPRPSSYWNFAPWPMYNWIWGFFLDQATGRGKEYSQKEYYIEM